MLRPRNPRQSSGSFNRFVYYFSLAMTFLYMGMGIFIIFFGEEYLNLDMQKSFRWILGGVLILYGLLRFMRTIRKNSNTDNDRL